MGFGRHGNMSVESTPEVQAKQRHMGHIREVLGKVSRFWTVQARTWSFVSFTTVLFCFLESEGAVIPLCSLITFQIFPSRPIPPLWTLRHMSSLLSFLHNVVACPPPPIRSPCLSQLPFLELLLKGRTTEGQITLHTVTLLLLLNHISLAHTDTTEAKCQYQSSFKQLNFPLGLVVRSFSFPVIGEL